MAFDRKSVTLAVLSLIGALYVVLIVLTSTKPGISIDHPFLAEILPTLPYAICFIAASLGTSYFLSTYRTCNLFGRFVACLSLVVLITLWLCLCSSEQAPSSTPVAGRLLDHIINLLTSAISSFVGSIWFVQRTNLSFFSPALDRGFLLCIVLLLVTFILAALFTALPLFERLVRLLVTIFFAILSSSGLDKGTRWWNKNTTGLVRGNSGSVTNRSSVTSNTLQTVSNLAQNNRESPDSPESQGNDEPSSSSGSSYTTEPSSQQELRGSRPMRLTTDCRTTREHSSPPSNQNVGHTVPCTNVDKCDAPVPCTNVDKCDAPIFNASVAGNTSSNGIN